MERSELTAIGTRSCVAALRSVLTVVLGTLRADIYSLSTSESYTSLVEKKLGLMCRWPYSTSSQAFEDYDCHILSSIIEPDSAIEETIIHVLVPSHVLPHLLRPLSCTHWYCFCMSLTKSPGNS
jgi:hypothetical protein